MKVIKIIFLIIILASKLIAAPFITNTTTSTLITKDENVLISLKITNSPMPSSVKIKFSKGVPDNWSSPYSMNYIPGSYYRYNYTIEAPQITPFLYYYFIITIQGTNYYCGSSDNPFKINVFEIDNLIPHIVHKPDYIDDEDDGIYGKYNGIAGNGIPDEDEDNLDLDPYEFQDGFTEDDTGNPWGITYVTIKNNPITIKAIFEEKEGSAGFDNDGKAYIFYKTPNSSFKKLEMKLIQGKVFAVDIPSNEVKNDIEYFLVAVDPSGLDPKTKTEFLNIAINYFDSFMYSGDLKDNDGDGSIDEEMNNNTDDDGDGLIDEDLNDASPILSKAYGKQINKTIVITNIKNGLEIINENQIDYLILSKGINPYKINVYENSEYVPKFNSYIPIEGTLAKNLKGEIINYSKKFPDGTEILVPSGAFDTDVKIVVSIPDNLPNLPISSSSKFIGFYRKIDVYDKYGKPIYYFKKPLIVTFHLSLLYNVKESIIVYYYNGHNWISIGGERSDVDKSQQIGYGNPLVVSINSPGIFVAIENPLEWQNVKPGSISELKTEPSVFTPNNDGKSDTTVIKFLLASNDDPRAIGDVPLYCPAILNIKIFDITGNLVRNLCQNYEIRFEWRYGSTIHYEWDGKDNNGNYVMPGVYIIEVEVKQISEWLSQDRFKILKETTAVVVVR
jgi:hypothetical protein